TFSFCEAPLSKLTDDATIRFSERSPVKTDRGVDNAAVHIADSLQSSVGMGIPVVQSRVIGKPSGWPLQVQSSDCLREQQYCDGARVDYAEDDGRNAALLLGAWRKILE